jgi:hypothetical protein
MTKRPKAAKKFNYDWTHDRQLVMADVNKMNLDQTHLGKQAVVEKLNNLIDQYKPIFTEHEPNKASGSNRFASNIE